MGDETRDGEGEARDGARDPDGARNAGPRGDEDGSGDAADGEAAGGEGSGDAVGDAEGGGAGSDAGEPPRPRRHRADETLRSDALPDAVECPHCGETESEQFSTFGSAVSVSQYYCRSCRTVFEFFKWR